MQRSRQMASKVQIKTVPTIWEVPCVLWSIVSEILVQVYPRKRVGRSRVCFRRTLNGIINRMRTGAQWNKLPKEFGDDSTVHRWFQLWCEDQLMARTWSVLATQCSYLGGVHYPLKRRRWRDLRAATTGAVCPLTRANTLLQVLCIQACPGLRSGDNSPEDQFAANDP